MIKQQTKQLTINEKVKQLAKFKIISKFVFMKTLLDITIYLDSPHTFAAVLQIIVGLLVFLLTRSSVLDYFRATESNQKEIIRLLRKIAGEAEIKQEEEEK